MQSEGLIAVANPAATAEDARIGRDGADAAESLAGPDSHGVAETLRQIAGIGRRNLRPMLGIVALALVAAAVLTLLTTRAYTAIASVQVDNASVERISRFTGNCLSERFSDSSQRGGAYPCVGGHGRPTGAA